MHDRRSVRVLVPQLGLALLAVLMSALAPLPASASEALTLSATVTPSCVVDGSSRTEVSIAVTNPSADVRWARVESSSSIDLNVPIAAGGTGYALLSVTSPSGPVTVAVIDPLDESVIYGPTTHPDPCADTGSPQPPVTASDVWVFCNDDEAEPRLFVNAALDNEGATAATVLFELSGQPGFTVSIPAGSFLTAGTWWSMAQAGDEVHVVLVLEPLDLVLFEGSFPNACLDQPEPATPEADPVTPEAPPGPHEGQVLETAMPVRPAGAVDGPVVAGEAVGTQPGTLPRTGASSLLLGTVAALLLVLGVVLTRLDSQDGAVERTVPS